MSLGLAFILHRANNTGSFLKVMQAPCVCAQWNFLWLSPSDRAMMISKKEKKKKEEIHNVYYQTIYIHICLYI